MNNESKLVVIPARLASTRLHEKLLLAESGKPLLAHTVERCLASSADRVIVAADHEALLQVAQEAGAVAILTEPALATGSDRVHAALQELNYQGRVINVQGDEPEIDPAAIDVLFESLEGGAPVATLAAPLPSAECLDDPAAVKVVSDSAGNALYFSRAPIPFAQGDRACPARIHMGIYAWQSEVLHQFVTLPPSPLELTERLEQLRLLEAGIPIRVLNWAHAFPGIDTRQDYDGFLNRVLPPSPKK